MAYDLEKWVANEWPVRRAPWLRWAYTAPLLLAPAAFVLDVGEGFGSPLLRALETLLSLGAVAGLLLAPFFALHARWMDAQAVEAEAALRLR